jgi:uncharacterized membrane protein YdjX (TVP38/TMEM64 family)
MPQPLTTMPEVLPEERHSSGGKSKLFLFIGFVAAAIAIAIFIDVKGLFASVNQSIDQLGVWGPVLFVGVYVTAAVLFIPASPLTVVAGAQFGLLMGTMYVSLASTLAATLSFLIGRYLARDWVAKKIERSPKFTAMDRAVAEEGWKMVALTRLSPVFGFALLNYGYGLTKVKFHEYVVASWLCMLPGTIAYVYVGVIGQAATEVDALTIGEWIMSGVGLVATFAVTIYITKLARRALKKRLDEDERTAAGPTAEA